MNPSVLTVRHLQRQPYLPVWQAMKAVTARRDAHHSDELWLLEHEAVYTLGLAGRPEHVLDPGTIALQHVDRGGQVTYHGPGQLVAYTLVDLRRRTLGVKDFVRQLESALITTLAQFDIHGTPRPGAPGVYTDRGKIAAIGLRVKRGCTYHGISLNVNMDLSPFEGINPCGHAGLAVTQIADYLPGIGLSDVIPVWIDTFRHHFGYQTVHATPQWPPD